ncbi:hypothetical protein KBX71_03030 [Micromonospora sp. D93]|uniref:hypothetical protein n=1 Tax=Micromonospora sp. D93 TaxID=2824886 RepID=UPI001B38B559|nr:hypothetical protein [Micromonospora sp. D93]MBQ1016835.1 hypothetical protein [Micromonospora sp. D93]
MGVIGGSLAGWALRRPHLLLAAVPGATAVRLAVEAEARRHGWSQATSPADADLLVVAGEPGTELAGAVDRVWDQFPGPRARVQVVDAQDAAAALREAAQRLHDCGGGGQGQHDGGHEGHGGMSMPGGLMMAKRANDRDGLKLDALHLALGPVLVDWPAGLVVELTVQGDVVQAATGRVLPPAQPVEGSYWDVGDADTRRRRHAAAHLDSLGRLWAVAGWEGGAEAVRGLRDEVVGGMPVVEAYRRFRTLDRRARRSRALRWATDGLGMLDATRARGAGVTGPAARSAEAGGDVTARWRCWLAETGRLLAGGEPADVGPRGGPVGGAPASAALLTEATRLMVGLDLAAARLVLASFDPDSDELLTVGVRR